jgi:tRNA A37 threonylcarbamoyladenosine synthetase subunit TsaC/SUA5/YrdC
MVVVVEKLKIRLRPQLTLVETPPLVSRPDERLQISTLSEGRQEAVDFIQQGDVVVFQTRGAYGMLVNGANPEAVTKALKLKGERTDKPMSTMYPASVFAPMIDEDKVHPCFQPFVTNPRKLSQAFGMMCHLRAPVTPAAAQDIPPSMISELGGTYYIHNIIPSGHGPLALLIKALKENGVAHVGVTSLNKHRQPEITDDEEALSFCQSCNGAVPLLLRDTVRKRDDVRGSYAIVDLSAATVSRGGQVPPEIIEQSVGAPLDRSSMKPPKYEPAPFPMEIFSDGLSPNQIRVAVTLFIRGNSASEIQEKLQHIPDLSQA